jgi:cell filamentation protein
MPPAKAAGGFLMVFFMAERQSQGFYTYPNLSADPDRTDVLRNKYGIRSHKELRIEEYRATAFRMVEIAEGDGPQGCFDKEHLKAVHGHIFQDVYEWAGHTRNESPIVDGHRVEPIGNLSKGGTRFLHGSRIEMGLDEAFKPIRNPDVLRGSSSEQFAEIAGKVMGELNYVHPFREGNGRAQEAFIGLLGHEYGHEIDFTVITEPRMIEASILTTNDPLSPAMAHVFVDAINPNRQEAIRAAFIDLEMRGEKAFEHNVRTAMQGEEISGQVLGHDIRVASVVTHSVIVAVDRADLPERQPNHEGL